jgi:hypothetical protein
MVNIVIQRKAGLVQPPQEEEFYRTRRISSNNGNELMQGCVPIKMAKSVFNEPELE